MKGILAVGADTQPGTADGGVAAAAAPAHLHGPDGLFAHLDADDRDARADGDSDPAVGE